MRSQLADHLLLASLVITTGLPATASVYSSTSGGAQGPTATQIAAGLEAGGLHEAARLNGGHYTIRMDDESHPYTYTSLEALARGSEYILIGDVLESEPHLTKSARYITTDCKIRVVDALLGRMPHGTEIVLSILGGTVVFSDGLSAAVDTPHFVPPFIGERILAFLKPYTSSGAHLAKEALDYANRDPVFWPVGGARGLFGLSADESHRVRPRSLKEDKLREQTRKKDVKTFVKEVRVVIENVEQERVAKDTGRARYPRLLSFSQADLRLKAGCLLPSSSRLGPAGQNPKSRRCKRLRG